MPVKSTAGVVGAAPFKYSPVEFTPSPELLYKSNFTATLLAMPKYPRFPPPTPMAAVEFPCTVNVKPSAVFPAVTWKLKSVVKFWIFTAVGNHALPVWVLLLAVKDSAVPLMAALPFSTMEPAVKPLPKLMPPADGAVTVKPFTSVALCPSESVTTMLCPPSTALAASDSVAVIFVAEL